VRGRSTRRPCLWTRLALSLLAALLLTAGSFEVHAASPDHMATRGLGGSVAEGASHPFESRHVESSETRVHPPCLACLLQLQSVGVGFAVPAALPSPPGEGMLPSGAAVVPSGSLPRSGSPRAPPVLLG
jgi:hypothetical protein